MMQPVQHAVAELKVVYINKQRAKERPTISTSADAHQILIRAFNHETLQIQEEFIVMYLNRANQVLGTYRCSVGGVTGTVADPRLILATALKVVAVSMILCHNHPSGTLRPSRQDEELTTKIKEGARCMDIKLLDHIIVSPDGENYYSFADEGLI